MLPRFRLASSVFVHSVFDLTATVKPGRSGRLVEEGATAVISAIASIIAAVIGGITMTKRAAVVTVSLVSLVPGLATAASKFASEQLDPTANVPEALAQRVEDVDPRAARFLPKMRVKVGLTGANTPTPALLQRLGLGAAQVSTASRSFTVDQPQLDYLLKAANAPEVKVIEIIAPNQLPKAPAHVPFNLDARLAHNVTLFEANVYGGQGASSTGLIIDGGVARPTHVEFQSNRVTLVEPGEKENAHATHVAGTMIASGVNPKARGMAPKMKLLSVSFNDDLTKLEANGANVIVSNHSYGPAAGWDQFWDGNKYAWVWYGDVAKSTTEDAVFGRYAGDCPDFDRILLKFPQLMAVVAAGNDRDDGPTSQPVSHYISVFNSAINDFEWVVSSANRALDGHKSGGYDTISGLGACKNGLTIGAVNDTFVEGHPNNSATRTTVFSAWGPLDDGRIKPDVVANGQSLLSTTVPSSPQDPTPDAMYDSMDGTSMASPTAAGIVALMSEYYASLHADSPPRSATIRALLAHTAMDAGIAGPDAIYGYGSINALRAGQVIRGDAGAAIHELVAKKNTDLTLKLDGQQGTAVRASIAWIDLPGASNVGAINDPTPALVVDFDVTLVSPSGKTYFPYRVDLASVGASARADGPNRVDNLEVVDAPGETGTWQVRISPKKLGIESTWPVSLIVTGLKRQ